MVAGKRSYWYFFRLISRSMSANNVVAVLVVDQITHLRHLPVFPRLEIHLRRG